jgi:hypothetical protein
VVAEEPGDGPGYAVTHLGGVLLATALLHTRGEQCRDTLVSGCQGSMSWSSSAGNPPPKLIAACATLVGGHLVRIPGVLVRAGFQQDPDDLTLGVPAPVAHRYVQHAFAAVAGRRIQLGAPFQQKPQCRHLPGLNRGVDRPRPAVVRKVGIDPGGETFPDHLQVAVTHGVVQFVRTSIGFLAINGSFPLVIIRSVAGTVMLRAPALLPGARVVRAGRDGTTRAAVLRSDGPGWPRGFSSWHLAGLFWSSITLARV